MLKLLIKIKNIIFKYDFLPVKPSHNDFPRLYTIILPIVDSGQDHVLFFAHMIRIDLIHKV